MHNKVVLYVTYCHTNNKMFDQFEYALTTLFTLFLFNKKRGNVVNTLYQPNALAVRKLTCCKNFNQIHKFMLTFDFNLQDTHTFPELYLCTHYVFSCILTSNRFQFDVKLKSTLN